MPHLTFRVSALEGARVERLARERGVSRSSVIRGALRREFELEHEQIAPDERDELDPIAERDELLALLTLSARAGSVTAARALLDEHRRDAERAGADIPDPFADLG